MGFSLTPCFSGVVKVASRLRTASAVSRDYKPLKRFKGAMAALNTPLKQGVNQRSARVQKVRCAFRSVVSGSTTKFKSLT